MARFRNRLIHVYDDIDDAVAFEVYIKHLKDFAVFANLIRLFIQAKGKSLSVNAGKRKPL